MNKQKLEEVLHDLNTVGYHKANIVDLLGPEGADIYEPISQLLEDMLNNPGIQHRLETIKQGLNIINKDKFYEITHQEHLNRALGLKDGGLFDFYLNDFFNELAERYLETDTPEIYNVLAWIHGEQPPSRSGSQNWHRDLEDLKILKIFMYCNDVTLKNGALQYTPKSFCGGDFPLNVGRTTDADYRAVRILNSEQEELCNKVAVTFEGGPGDIMIVNNTGYHRGGLVTEGFRCMVHALYIRPDAQFKPANINYDSQVNIVDPNSEEYKNLKHKQKYIKL